MFAIMPMETEGHGREFGRRQKMRAKCTVEFVCKYCQRRFTKPYNLMIHERSHKDDVTFTCEVCGKTFKRQDNLKQHSIDNKDENCDSIVCIVIDNHFTNSEKKPVTVLTSRRSKPLVRPKETATALTFRINSLVMLQRVAFTRLVRNRSVNRARERRDPRRSANFALLLLPTGASRRAACRSAARVARTRAGPIESGPDP
ncbi:Protein drumstick [Cyphomyrmex costatus]|uniref:Protein drumstick n=1 Tax=Cyphomyrmex costatus TaxID=456900 RepID=A0A195CNE7_9HYME|nr:Protein drumstick [Cyphomyrmex costatus]